LEDALVQGKSLLQAELSLARKELSSEVDAAVGAGALLLVGFMFLQAGLVTLGVLLVLWLGVGAPAALLVAALLVFGAASTVVAVRTLQRRKLQRTAARLSLDAKQVLETVKQ
jgi:uncharacterized membrane protein YqjE